MDNASEGGGGGIGSAWWRNIGNEAKDKNAQPPWEFDDKKPMEEIHVIMGVGVGAATAVADAADPHQRDAKVNRDSNGEEDGDVDNDDNKGAAHTMDAPFDGKHNNQKRLLRFFHHKVLFERDNTVVHEQGGGG